MYKIIKSAVARETGYYKVPLRQLIIEEEAPPKQEEPPVLEPEEKEPEGPTAEELLAEARQALEEAQEEADRILAAARAEAESILAKARETAQEELAAAREKAAAELKSAVTLGDEIRKELIRTAEMQVLELTLAIAETLVKDSPLVAPEIIKDIVARSLCVLEKEESLTVFVNPEDLEACRAFKDQWMELLDRETTVRILPSAEVKRGGCIVQGQYARVESCLEEQFRRVKEALLKEAGHGTASGNA